MCCVWYSTVGVELVVRVLRNEALCGKGVRILWRIFFFDLGALFCTVLLVVEDFLTFVLVHLVLWTCVSCSFVVGIRESAI